MTSTTKKPDIEEEEPLLGQEGNPKSLNPLQIDNEARPKIDMAQIDILHPSVQEVFSPGYTGMSPEGKLDRSMSEEGPPAPLRQFDVNMINHPKGLFVDNSITTSKYNAFTFLPKNLIE